MNDEEITTLWWISEMTAELVEMDVPAEVAQALDRGQGVIGYSDYPQRRYKGQDAEDRLQTRLDAIRDNGQ